MQLVYFKSFDDEKQDKTNNKILECNQYYFDLNCMISMCYS